MAEKEKDVGLAFELKRAAREEGGEERTGRGEGRRRGSDSRAAAKFDPLPEHLRRKYYVLDAGAEEIKIYADRSGEYLVAKAERDRLVTQVASIEIVRDLVAIAAHRGWERVELTGSAEFRREAWLAASARGIEANGYEPTELDRAALAKIQGQSDRGDRTHPFGRDKTGARAPAQRAPSMGRYSNWGAEERNARSHLAVIERVVLAAFPKDPEARKRVLDAARERMAHHRRRGARFGQAEIIDRTASPSREGPSKAAAKAREPSRIQPRQRNR